ncbi:hypothetical protein [Novosphingobium sp. JCM 18896]|uniref:hypothetical protein n=1 Tax=Novosphingobium sp. JCM 18896 TaxID=2989731 RepID=UPI00222207C6|nr:hypothetical protein [Novosphingobium sp. JCM 18896]MCW1432189.1 hypothetical protein [Novosphingobium sp. JCM 18896]
MSIDKTTALYPDVGGDRTQTLVTTAHGATLCAMMGRGYANNSPAALRTVS